MSIEVHTSAPVLFRCLLTRPTLVHSAPPTPPPYTPPQIRSVKVPSIRLDSAFESETIFLLKIDVEGHDPAVLEGAQRLFEQQRVHCLAFEYHHKGLWADPPAPGRLKGIVADLHTNGYSVYRIGRERLIQIDGACWTDCYATADWTNLFAILRTSPLLPGLLSQPLL